MTVAGGREVAATAHGVGVAAAAQAAQCDEGKAAHYFGTTPRPSRAVIPAKAGMTVAGGLKGTAITVTLGRSRNARAFP